MRPLASHFTPIAPEHRDYPLRLLFDYSNSLLSRRRFITSPAHQEFPHFFKNSRKLP